MFFAVFMFDTQSFFKIIRKIIRKLLQNTMTLGYNKA